MGGFELQTRRDVSIDAAQRAAAVLKSLAVVGLEFGIGAGLCSWF
jgi:hypothetical protein